MIKHVKCLSRISLFPLVRIALLTVLKETIFGKTKGEGWSVFAQLFVLVLGSQLPEVDVLGL